MSCCKRYLLESITDPNCMSCKRAWNHDLLYDQFPKTFLHTELKKRREELLFDHEKSLMPATQVYVEMEMKTSTFKKQASELRARIKTLKHELMNGGNTHAYIPLDEWEKQERHLVAKRIEVDACRHELKFATDMNQRILRTNLNVNRERRQFMRSCPAEGCRGFLSSQWKCGLCNVWVCPDCHEVKGGARDTEHTCKPENIETAKLLAKDTKPCPNCATMIFKIEGCDQMFCTQCHTAFSWRTGRIESGVIHNPHYYEYLRQHNGGNIPRNLGDVPCGGVPHPHEVRYRMNCLNVARSKTDHICGIIRFIHHINNILLPRYRTDMVEENRDLRIRYMMNEIDEDKFKRLLQQREKARVKKQNIFMILQMFATSLTDIVQRIYTVGTDSNDVEMILTEVPNLRSYISDTLAQIAQRYNCAVPLEKELRGL